MSEVKKFKSAFESSPVELLVEGHAEGEGVFLEIEQKTILIAPSDAPALALAILGAAGVEACHRDYESYDDGSPAHLQAVMYFLKQYNEAQAERAAAEADRVKLEAEALKLAQAGCEAVGDDSAETLDEMTVKDQKFSLAVARAARELNKEDGQ